jgi:RNA polymerase sigma factor (sigma-70 family)
MNASLEQLAEEAQAGNSEAMESLVEQIQDKIYGLALRMLWHREDARDATQEILIRVITRLGSFRGESKFMTWIYRIAANHLRDARKSRLEEQQYTFERFGDELDEGLSDAPIQSEQPIDEALLLEEIKIGCTLGMLLCLDRGHRLAYILGEILEIESAEAAEILEITPAAFRKRLSRARAGIVDFMKKRCGLVNPGNPCRCRRRINHALKLGRINPKQLLFAQDAGAAARFPEVLSEIRKLEGARACAALYRSHPDFALAESFVTFLRRLVDSQDLGLVKK